MTAPDPPETTRDHNGNVTALQVTLSVAVGSHLLLLNVTFTCASAKDFPIVTCAYHCGPLEKPDEVYFRICMNDKQGFHFHLRGLGGDVGEDHIPHDKAVPPISLEPDAFLRLVETFLAAEMKTLPLEVQP